MKTRAERRNEEAKAKHRAKRKMEVDGTPTTPARVGKHAATHGTCDCWMCKMGDGRSDLFRTKGWSDDTG